MPQIDVSAKMLRLLIEAVDFRIAAYATQTVSESLSEYARADIGNDRAVLQALNSDLKRHEAKEKDADAPPGDHRARAKLRLIMHCLLTEGFSEADQDQLMAMGRAASPDPAWTNYLYWPERFGLDGSVDAALDKAFAYRAITLGSP